MACDVLLNESTASLDTYQGENMEQRLVVGIVWMHILVKVQDCGQVEGAFHCHVQWQ